MTSGRKLRAVALVAIVSLQILAVVPASSLAKTTSGGNAPVSAAGSAPGVAMPDATIDDTTNSNIEIAYNATGVSSPQLVIFGPNGFSEFIQPVSLSQKGTTTVTIPSDTFGGGQQLFSATLLDGAGNDVASDRGVVTASSPVILQSYSLSSNSVSVGENVTVNATLVNTDSSSAHDYTLTLYDIYGPGMKHENKSRTVTVPAGETTYATFNRSYVHSGLQQELTINEQPTKTVSVTNPVQFVNYTLSSRTVGVDEDVWVNATLHNPSSSPVSYRLFFTAVDEASGNWQYATQSNHTTVQPGYQTVPFKTNFSSTGEHFTFLDSTSGSLADPKIFVVDATAGSPNVTVTEVNKPQRAIVDEPTLFVAQLENDGDAAGVKNVTLQTDGNTTSEHFMVEPGQRRFVFLEHTYDSKGTQSATFAGETFDVEVGDPIVVDSSIEYVNGSPGSTPTPMPNLDTRLSPFGMVSVQITNESGSQDLSSLNVDDTTTFRVNVSLQNYEPRVLVSSGQELDWQRVNDTEKGLTNVSILVNPARLDYKDTDATVENWDQKVQNDRADFGMDAAILTGISDGTHPFFDTEPSTLAGMSVSTDAQLFRPPVYQPPAPGQSPQLQIQLAAPHETADGDLNDGYYRAFLPDALLDEWDVNSTDELDVSYSADPSASFEVTNVSDGMMVNLTHHYSAGTAVITADTVAPTVSVGADRTVDEGDTVSFDASGTIDNDAVDTIEWDFGDGSAATGATASHTYSSAGTYTATVTATDASGNVATDSVTVTVEEATSGSDSTNSRPSRSSGPDISVVDATLEQTGIESGTSVLIEATLANDGSGDGTYELELAVDGEVVDRSEVHVSGKDSRTVTFLRTFEEAGSFDVSISDVDAGTLTVEAVATPTPTPTPESTATATPTPESTATPTSEQTPEQTATPTASPTEANTDAGTPGTGAPATADDSPTPSPTATETTGQPGFGIVVSLVALLVTGMLVRRHHR